MKFLIAALFMLLCINTSQAQIFEIGPYLGGSNFIGDVGATNYIRPNSIAVGGIVKWNRSLRHAWRASLIYTSLKADDAKSNQGRRRARGYSFDNKMVELTLGMEFNFWDWNIYSSKPQIVPYIATGITGLYAHDLYVDSKQNLKQKDRKFGLALPMIIGVKGKINTRWVLAVEVGARMAFTDNLDGSNPSEFDGSDTTYPSFGNPNTNDWYMFSGITLTYTFGHNPCYDVY